MFKQVGKEDLVVVVVVIAQSAPGVTTQESMKLHLLSAIVVYCTLLYKVLYTLKRKREFAVKEEELSSNKSTVSDFESDLI